MPTGARCRERTDLARRRTRAPPALRAAPFDEAGVLELAVRGRYRDPPQALAGRESPRSAEKRDGGDRARSPTNSRRCPDRVQCRRVCRQALRTAASAPASRTLKHPVVPGARAERQRQRIPARHLGERPPLIPVERQTSPCPLSWPVPSATPRTGLRELPMSPPSAARHRSPPRSSSPGRRNSAARLGRSAA